MKATHLGPLRLSSGLHIKIFKNKVKMWTWTWTFLWDLTTTCHLLKYYFSPYWYLHSSYSQKLCFWIKTPIIKIIFVIYYSPTVCISCGIALKVVWFKVEICEKCIYSSTAFIFLYLMMNFLLIVDKAFGFLIYGFSKSTKLLNYFLAFVIRYTLGVFLLYTPYVITTRTKLGLCIYYQYIQAL